MRTRILVSFVLCAGLMLCLCGSTRGGGTCVAGPVSGLIGTTCNIGDLTFTFVDYSSTSSLNYVSSFNVGPLRPANVYLTPVTNGFTLSFTSGRVTVKAPPGRLFSEGAALNYRVSGHSVVLTGQTTTYGSIQVAPGGGWAQAVESSYTYPRGSTSWFGEMKLCLNFNATSIVHCDLGKSVEYKGRPVNWASGTAGLNLVAANGSSAGWDGSPMTVTYSVTRKP